MLPNLAYEQFSCPSSGFMRVAWGDACADAATAMRGNVLICPGFGEWIEKYQETIQHFQKRGFRVAIVEWRGQGGSSRFLADTAKAYLPPLNELVDDLDAFYQAKLKDAGKLIVLSHSMGGHLYLRWRCGKGKNYPISGSILSNPLHLPNTAPFPFAAARMIVDDAMRKKKGEEYAPTQKGFDTTKVPFLANLLTHDAPRYDAMMASLREKPELKHGGVVFAALNAMIQSAPLLIKELGENPPAEPSLYFASNQDRIVSVKGLQLIASMLPRAQTRFFDGTHHELFQEKDSVQTEIWRDIDGFIEKLA